MGKRPATSSQVMTSFAFTRLNLNFVLQHPSKKRKLNKTHTKPSTKTKGVAKKKDAIKETIDIPDIDVEDEEGVLSDQDMDLLDTYGGAVTFLDSLDRKGISRCVLRSISLTSYLIFMLLLGVNRR